MTALPPAGWYPDPEAGGSRWRWWDGVGWSPPSYGFGAIDPAQLLETYRNATSRYGRWLRWAMVANLASVLLVAIGFAFVFRGDGFDVFTTEADGTSQFPGRLSVFQLATLPLNLVTLAYVGSLIAWILHAGKFAEALGWPAARSRTVGAFSVLIPVVNLWWPYEAVRDSYPPGAGRPLVIRWWVSYLVAPATSIPMFIVAFIGTPIAIAITIAISACMLAIPVWFGWKLIRETDAMQLANAPAPM